VKAQKELFGKAKIAIMIPPTIYGCEPTQTYRPRLPANIHAQGRMAEVPSNFLTYVALL
jgi:hypothetical protein